MEEIDNIVSSANPQTEDEVIALMESLTPYGLRGFALMEYYLPGFQIELVAEHEGQNHRRIHDFVQPENTTGWA